MNSGGWEGGGDGFSYGEYMKSRAIGAGGGRKGLEAMIAAAAAQAQEAEAPAPPLTVDASAALNISDDKTAIAESAYRRFLLPSFSVAMVTPFDANSEFEPRSVDGLVKHLIDAGAPALLISGSTGEQHCLSIDERCQLYQLCRESAGPAFPLFAGVSAMKTKLAVALAQAAVASGMSGIMLGFTPYSKLAQRDAEAYVKAVASAAPALPIFLYNNSKRVPFNLAPETFMTILSQCPNVVGIKEVVDAQVSAFKAAVSAAALDDRPLSYFSGSDGAFVEQFSDFGFTSLTSIAGQIFPREMQAVVALLKEGDRAAAAAQLAAIEPGLMLLSEGGLLQSVKHVLRGRGAPAGHCCLPLLELSEAQQAKLDAHFVLNNKRA